MSNNCRACGSNTEILMVDLGEMPLANSYLSKDDVCLEQSVPLKVVVCEECFLAQTTETVNPHDIFSDYAYFSSFSESWLKHAEIYCSNIIESLNLTPNSFVVEIASNDGYLLKNFVDKDISVLGIEPAKNIAKEANSKGINTLSEFFGSDLAYSVAKSHGKPDLIVGNNVLAHVPNISDFIKGLSILLGSEGVITMEFPHLLRLVESNQFDTIYHEHYSYLSITTVDTLFQQHGLKIFDVEELVTHGGSVRIHATHIDNNRALSTRVIQLKCAEVEAGLTSYKGYEEFNRKVSSVKSELLALIENLKGQGKSIVGYGAAAKGNTLLNYCNLDSHSIDFIADLNPNKQNMLMPGSHIPIVSPEQIKLEKPEYIVILPWNLKEEIMSQLDYVKAWGAKFIVPIPTVEVIS